MRTISYAMHELVRVATLSLSLQYLGRCLNTNCILWLSLNYGQGYALDVLFGFFFCLFVFIYVLLSLHSAFHVPLRLPMNRIDLVIIMSLWFYFMLCNARKSSRQQRVNRKGIKTDFYIRSAFCGKLNDAPFVRNCNILPQWDNSYRRTLTWCDVCRGCTGLKPFRPCTACPTWGRINSTSIGVVHQINLRCGENRQQQTSAIVTAPQTITKWNKSSLSQLKLMWWRCRHSTNEYQLVPCANCVCEGGGERERESELRCSNVTWLLLFSTINLCCLCVYLIRMAQWIE